MNVSIAELLYEVKYFAIAYGTIISFVAVNVLVFIILWVVQSLVLKIYYSFLEKDYEFKITDFLHPLNIINGGIVLLLCIIEAGIYCSNYGIGMGTVLQFLGLLLVGFGFLIQRPLMRLYDKYNIKKGLKVGEFYTFYHTGKYMNRIYGKIDSIEIEYLKLTNCIIETKIKDESKPQKYSMKWVNVNTLSLPYDLYRNIIWRKGEVEYSSEF